MFVVALFRDPPVRIVAGSGAKVSGKIDVISALLPKRAGNNLVLPADTAVTHAFDFDARKVSMLKTVAWVKIGPKDIGAQCDGS